MRKTIAVAGATGNLGRRVVHALLARGAAVLALVRTRSEQNAVASLSKAGAKTMLLDDPSEVRNALTDSACVVSTLSGLRETILDAQSELLDAAVAAGVPRFVPSDFSVDFMRLEPGQNRNLDLRREFHVQLDASRIRATSVMNGMFADILATEQSPFFDFDARRVNYWGSPDQPMDFTTMDDTAAFTAAVALDDGAPRVLGIAGDRLDARGLAAIASEVFGKPFGLHRLGGIEDLDRKIVDARRFDPKADTTVFAPFQALQYVRDMSSGNGRLDTIDNDRYPGIAWTRIGDLLARGSQR